MYILDRKRRLIAAIVLIVATIVIVVTVVTIAAVAYILFLRPSSDREAMFGPTAVGVPNGLATTKSIGPAGGTLASPDGRLTLTVPQNALTDTVAFTIQPITNKAGGGLGSAYRLGPDRKTFTTPLDISVRYDEHDLEGTVAEALSLAYQDEQGAWRAQKSAKLDQAAKTLTVSTTHFTDFAFLARLRMSPLEATLHVGESRFIQLLECKEPGFLDKILSRPVDCSASPPGKVSWKVRGPGTIKNTLSRRLTGVLYTAPAKKPTDNIVYVDLTIDFELREPATGRIYNEQRTFRTKITIIDWGYRATGQSHDAVYEGVICDLEKPFTVNVTGLADFAVKFVPSSSPTSGTASYTSSYVPGGAKATEVGGGSYTVEGIDTDKPRIVWNVRATATVSVMGRSVSVPGKSDIVYINLTPLESDECGGK